MPARIYRGTSANLARLAGVLKRGGLVAVPTETVYGLAANALDARACARIFQAKGRPKNDPLIVHAASLAAVADLAELNDAARKLARAFWPGPLTLVLPKKAIVPAIVTAGQASVAVRMPRHPLLRRLLRACGLPLAAPSANPFGYISPTTARHVQQSLGGKIRHILDGGPCRIGVESTILDLRDSRRPVLLRPGAITRREIEAVLGKPVRLAGPVRPAATRRAMPAPGLLSRHYSPRTPLQLHARVSPAMIARASRRDAWLLRAKPPGKPGPNVFWLDARGDARRAARRLFATLRTLDDGGWRRIHAELAAGGRGPVAAINDRLARAAAKHRP